MATRWDNRFRCARSMTGTAACWADLPAWAAYPALGEGSELAGQALHVGGDLVFVAVRQAEEDFRYAECGTARQFLAIRFEVQGHDLRRALPAGRGPGVLQQLHRLVDVEVTRGGDPAVRAARDPLEVLFGARRAHQYRNV